MKHTTITLQSLKLFQALACCDPAWRSKLIVFKRILIENRCELGNVVFCVHMKGAVKQSLRVQLCEVVLVLLPSLNLLVALFFQACHSSLSGCSGGSGGCAVGVGCCLSGDNQGAKSGKLVQSGSTNPNCSDLALSLGIVPLASSLAFRFLPLFVCIFCFMIINHSPIFKGLGLALEIKRNDNNTRETAIAVTSSAN